jgi:hypothetical protein
MPSRHRWEVLRRYLASAPGLRLEFSLRLAEGRLRPRSAPLFWLGAAHRDSQAEFARVRQLLSALDGPEALLECHRAHSPDSLYQGVAIDLDAPLVRGTLFMHCRDERHPVHALPRRAAPCSCTAATRRANADLDWAGRGTRYRSPSTGPVGWPRPATATGC